MAEGNTVLVDVREDFEHAEERIPGARLSPLSRFDVEALRAANPGKRLVFHCRSGKRSMEAAERFCTEGTPSLHLAGGIEGWKAAGLPVTRPKTAPRLPVMRQVQLAAGFLVAMGVGLGFFVWPGFFALSAFVGCGLMFAGATGWCGMALVLARMPWNRAAPNTSCCTE